MVIEEWWIGTMGVTVVEERIEVQRARSHTDASTAYILHAFVPLEKIRSLVGNVTANCEWVSPRPSRVLILQNRSTSMSLRLRGAAPTGPAPAASGTVSSAPPRLLLRPAGNVPPPNSVLDVKHAVPAHAAKPAPSLRLAAPASKAAPATSPVTTAPVASSAGHVSSHMETLMKQRQALLAASQQRAVHAQQVAHHAARTGSAPPAVTPTTVPSSTAPVVVATKAGPVVVPASASAPVAAGAAAPPIAGGECKGCAAKNKLAMERMQAMRDAQSAAAAAALVAAAASGPTTPASTGVAVAPVVTAPPTTMDRLRNLFKSSPKPAAPVVPKDGASAATGTGVVAVGATSSALGAAASPAAATVPPTASATVTASDASASAVPATTVPSASAVSPATTTVAGPTTTAIAVPDAATSGSPASVVAAAPAVQAPPKPHTLDATTLKVGHSATIFKDDAAVASYANQLTGFLNHQQNAPKLDASVITALISAVLAAPTAASVSTIEPYGLLYAVASGVNAVGKKWALNYRQMVVYTLYQILVEYAYANRMPKASIPGNLRVWIGVYLYPFLSIAIKPSGIMSTEKWNSLITASAGLARTRHTFATKLRATASGSTASSSSVGASAPVTASATGPATSASSDAATVAAAGAIATPAATTVLSSVASAAPAVSGDMPVSVVSGSAAVSAPKAALTLRPNRRARASTTTVAAKP